MTSSKHSKKQKENDALINVVTVDPPVSSSTVMFDAAKAKAAMVECEKHVTAVSSKKTPDTWEEQISRWVKPLHHWSNSKFIRMLRR